MPVLHVMLVVVSIDGEMVLQYEAVELEVNQYVGGQQLSCLCCQQ